jgi:rare lipoprotein A
MQKGKLIKAPIVDLESGPSSGAVTKTVESAPSVETPSSGATTAPVQAGGYLAGDGPGADIPANLDSVPDAVPKAEPLHRYANREYVAQGTTYKPLLVSGSYKETGIASWYGKKFHGQRTSIGEVYDMYGMTAAHPTLPVPSYARVTNVETKKSVIVRINDRGPFLHERIIDLSYVAAYKLGIINNGSAKVEVESIATNDTGVTEASAAPEPITSTPLAPAPVVEPVAAAVPALVAPVAKPAVVAAVGNVYLQLGAFKSDKGAESFMAEMRKKLGADGKLSRVQKGGLERITLGPYATKEEARLASEKLKAQLGFKPYVSAP